MYNYKELKGERSWHQVVKVVRMGARGMWLVSPVINWDQEPAI